MKTGDGAQRRGRRGPGACPTTIAMLVIAPLLYCVGELIGSARSPHEYALRPSRVAGRVVDPGQGVAVAGARVIVWAPDTGVNYPSYERVAAVESGPDGEFVVDYDHRVGDVYRLSAQADGYEGSDVTPISAGDQADIVVTLDVEETCRFTKNLPPRGTNKARLIAGIGGVRVGRLR